VRHGLLTMRSKYMAAYRKARSHFLKEFTKRIRTVVLQQLLLHFVCSPSLPDI
jgi:hypothetical protein